MWAVSPHRASGAPFWLMHPQGGRGDLKQGSPSRAVTSKNPLTSQDPAVSPHPSLAAATSSMGS